MGTIKERATFAPQLSYDTSTGTGSYLAFSGPLVQNPAILIFDNQSNTAVTVSDDGTTDGKTFSAGEALVLDLRTNGPNIKELTWAINTQFYASSAAGVGNFYISIIYAA